MDTIPSSWDVEIMPSIWWVFDSRIIFRIALFKNMISNNAIRNMIRESKTHVSYSG